jgi:hypothetical protein
MAMKILRFKETLIRLVFAQPRHAASDKAEPLLSHAKIGDLTISHVARLFQFTNILPN